MAATAISLKRIGTISVGAIGAALLEGRGAGAVEGRPVLRVGCDGARVTEAGPETGPGTGAWDSGLVEAASWDGAVAQLATANTATLNAKPILGFI